MNRIVLIILFYFLTLSAAIVLPNGISDYNAYILCCLCILYILLIKSSAVYRSSLLCGLALCLTSILNFQPYTLVDCALIFSIFGSIYIGLHFPIKKKELRFFKYCFFFIYLISLLGIFNPSLYRDTGDGFRYSGLFHAVNFSASIFSILGIAIWEIEKTERKTVWILLILIMSLLIYIWATSTRSLLFTLPYWLYQLYTRCNKTVLVTSILLICILYLPSIIEAVSVKLRLEENESSIATRSVLYLQLLSGIRDNYGIIPHGSHAATQMIVDFTGDPLFSPHNDILTYIYDWGAVFYIFCIMIGINLKKYISFNIEFCLILLVIIACALHNMMLSLYIWIPFIIILTTRRNINDPYTNFKAIS